MRQERTEIVKGGSGLITGGKGGDGGGENARCVTHFNWGRRLAVNGREQPI